MMVASLVIPGLTRDLGRRTKIPGQARDDKIKEKLYFIFKVWYNKYVWKKAVYRTEMEEGFI